MKLLKWFHKNPQEWYYIYQIREVFGDFIDEVFLNELVAAGYLSRTVPIEEYPREDWEEPVYLYRITEAGNAWAEGWLGESFDKWSTRFCAIWGAITGTIAIAMEIMEFLGFR